MPGTSKSNGLGENEFRIPVNGAIITFDKGTGRITSGPPAMRDKYIAPSQREELMQTTRQRGWHGHLVLAENQDEVRLAESELDLMRINSVDPEILVPGMPFDYNGQTGWRIEEIENAVATISREGAGYRPVPLGKLVRDAEFHPENFITHEANLSADEIEQLYVEDGITEANAKYFQCPDCKKKGKLEPGKSTILKCHCGKKMVEVRESDAIVYSPGQDVWVDTQIENPKDPDKWVRATVLERHPDTEGEMWDEDEYDIEFADGIPENVKDHVAIKKGSRIFRKAPESWLHRERATRTKEAYSDVPTEQLISEIKERLFALETRLGDK